MHLTVLNDGHCGAIRGAGTTDASRWALRKHLLQGLKSLLPDTGDLLYLGDLFDTNNVPVADVLHVYLIFDEWLTSHPTAKLYNAAGNHDESKTSNVLSSFQFLGALLTRRFPDRYIHIEKAGKAIPYGYVIPHIRNQDLFDHELTKVPQCQTLFLHCNYDNNFAVQSDQSLNLSPSQVEALPVDNVVIAHEHHHRKVGKVWIPGNQVASSVSDWLPAVDKFCVTVSKLGLQFKAVAVRADEYIDMDFSQLEETDKKFIRVSGKAEPEQVNAIMTKINKLRAAVDAFVIANAVTVASDEGLSEVFSSNLESLQRFSVIDALRKILTPAEMVIVEKYAERTSFN